MSILPLAEGTFGYWDIVAVVVYMVATAYLGYLGWKRTQTSADYLVGGRKTHPVIMALSYGSTFISTSAIVGFGGVAAQFGMSLLWLTVCNIFVGIFIAFVVLGAPTRRLGHALDAHTFPELLGRRYGSKFVQVFAGLIIFFLMPLYAAAVLMGGCEFIMQGFGINYATALLIFTVIVAGYVIYGGLKGVMYTDALQGTIMTVGMLVLLVYTYYQVGGVVDGHQALTDLKGMVPPSDKAMGQNGWTSFPAFGFGASQYNLWWIVVSTLIMGVGIGVLAQPQLVVRFMTVKSRKELNRALIIGGVFILLMTGTAFVTGSLSNVFFHRHGALVTGKVKELADPANNRYLCVLQKQAKGNTQDVMLKGKPYEVYIDADKAQPEPYKPGDIMKGHSVAIVQAEGNSDRIIPAFITSAMPRWFGLLFLLTLLAAAMSTLSGQYHALGTAISRDVYEQFAPRAPAPGSTRNFLLIRLGILVGIIIATAIAYYMRGGNFIPRATAIFFGICACTFLPTYVGGLFFRGVTKAGAIASMIVGSAAHITWVVLVKLPEAQVIGLAAKFLPRGQFSILQTHPNWPMVDPLFIGLPLSAATLIVVSLLSRRPRAELLDRCFPAKK